MQRNEERLRRVERNLSIALGLEVFVELSFFVAGLAILGAFSGGAPTSTPVLAQGYIAAGALVTIIVMVRTRQMLSAISRGDLAGLEKMGIRTWALLAFVFSAILPAIYLSAAASAMPRRP